MPWKRFLGQRINALVIFLDISESSSTGVVTFSILCMRALGSPQPHQSRRWDFWIFANLIGQNWYVQVICICISLTVSRGDHLSWRALYFFGDKIFNSKALGDSRAVVRKKLRSHVIFTNFLPKVNILQKYNTLAKSEYWCWYRQDEECSYHYKHP